MGQLGDSEIRGRTAQEAGVKGGPRDFDIEGANWVEMHSIGSMWQEELDISRVDGKWRHRRMPTSDQPHDFWREGRAP